MEINFLVGGLTILSVTWLRGRLLSVFFVAVCVAKFKKKKPGNSSYTSSNTSYSVCAKNRYFQYCHFTVPLVVDKHPLLCEAASFISWMMPPDQRVTGRVLIGQTEIKRSLLSWCHIWTTFPGSAVTAGATNKPLTPSHVKSGKRIKT